MQLKQLARYSAIALAGCIFLGVVTSLLPRRWQTQTRSPSDCSETIYVSGGATHVNLIVPVKSAVFDWQTSLNLQDLGANSQEFRYLQFGWGDRIWYAETSDWGEGNVLSGLRALFWQNPAALFVMGHNQVPRYPNETLRCLRLSKADYQGLIQFIERSFQTNGQGKQRIPTDPGRIGAFYEATGRYSLLYTCNSWAASALHAGQVTTPIWGSLAPAVMRQLGNGCPPCETAAIAPEIQPTLAEQKSSQNWKPESPNRIN